MSARAAWRLEELGFGRVYDYVPGKVDWMAAGLPLEGSKADRLRVRNALRTNPPTCSSADTVEEALARMGDGWDLCVVVNRENVVLGRIRRNQTGGDPNARVGDVMEIGPTTTRASTRLEKIAERLQGARTDHVLVTEPEGRLLGVLYEADARAMLAREGAA